MVGTTFGATSWDDWPTETLGVAQVVASTTIGFATSCRGTEVFCGEPKGLARTSGV